MNRNYQAILYDGVVMPLVDSEDSLIDTILSETLNNLFTISKNGQIIDSSGNFWTIWSTTELELWWNIFESVVGIPFGRKLFNSCCDEEEYQIFNSELLVNGFFCPSSCTSESSSDSFDRSLYCVFHPEMSTARGERLIYGFYTFFIGS